MKITPIRSKMLSSDCLIHLVSIVGTLNLVATLSETAPILTAPDSKTIISSQVEVLSPLTSSSSPTGAAAVEVSSSSSNSKLVKRDSQSPLAVIKTKSSFPELDSQETGYLPVGGGYQAADSDYGYDSGKNTYGKQASDWSLYDQGNHGLYDKYGDKAWNDQGHNSHSSHGKHDSYGNSYNSHGSGHGSGYYSRDRGYGYEKHYAYDKEVASKQHGNNHNSYGSNHGLHDHYGNTASQSHANHGHDKYGQLSRYGNHGYGKRGSSSAAHHDYGHNQNKGHYYSQSSQPQSSYPSSYSAHVPTYRSTYSDYSPQIGYPSSYPSYY